PLADEPRLGGARDIIDPKPAAEVLLSLLTLALMVHEHDALGHTDLMGMPARRHFDMRQQPRAAGIGDIDNARPRRGAHMTDLEGRAVDPDLPAAGAIEMGEELGVPGTHHDPSAQSSLTVSPVASLPCF